MSSAWTQCYIQTLRRNQQLGSRLQLSRGKSAASSSQKQLPADWTARGPLPSTTQAQWPCHGKTFTWWIRFEKCPCTSVWIWGKLTSLECAAPTSEQCSPAFRFLPSTGRRSQLPKAKAQLATSLLVHTSSRQGGRKENGQIDFLLWKAKTIIKFCKQDVRVIKNWQYILLTCAFFLA